MFYLVLRKILTCYLNITFLICQPFIFATAPYYYSNLNENEVDIDENK